MTSEDHFSCGVFLGMMVDFIEEFCIWVGKGTYNGLTFLIGSSVYIDEVHLDMRRLCALAVWSGRLFAFWRYGKKESAWNGDVCWVKKLPSIQIDFASLHQSYSGTIFCNGSLVKGAFCVELEVNAD